MQYRRFAFVQFQLYRSAMPSTLLLTGFGQLTGNLNVCRMCTMGYRGFHHNLGCPVCIASEVSSSAIQTFLAVIKQQPPPGQRASSFEPYKRFSSYQGRRIAFPYVMYIVHIFQCFKVYSIYRCSPAVLLFRSRVIGRGICCFSALLLHPSTSDVSVGTGPLRMTYLILAPETSSG